MLAASVLDIEWYLVALCLLVVLVGSTLQASIGIGLGLLAAPVLGLVDPDFIPAAVAVAVVPLVVGMTLRERHEIDRPGLRSALIGRIPGVAIGGWVAAVADHRTTALVVAAAVLIAVIGSLTGLRFMPTSQNLMIAGAASGFTGTSAGVGGPPMALTYQHSDPAVLRATLAAYNSIGSAMTLTVLVATSVLGRREFQLGLLLVPAVITGLLLGRLTVGRLPPARVRPIVLAVCSASALTLVIAELA